MDKQSLQHQDLEGRLRSGDERALADLFSLHRPRLWRMVQFRLDPRLSGRVDPDDVLQEAWLAARQRIDRYSGDGFSSPFVWLRIIVQQTLIDVHRRHLGARMRDIGREVQITGRVYPQATSASLAIHLVGDWTSPSQAAARGEMLETVQQSIEAMDPIDQEILALRHFEELSNGEAAEVLGIQPKAASIRYVRAIRRLKAILADVPGLFDEQGHVQS
ncbi:MAG: sigma-70 family RNA polymerase sigma factor [Planctomycetes bacterium]|nr:sigma-70 family RNA polymerase sigma factor [Planctomycetota bacterium]